MIWFVRWYECWLYYASKMATRQRPPRQQNPNSINWSMKCSAQKIRQDTRNEIAHEIKKKDEQMTAIKTQREYRWLVLNIISISSVIIIGLLIILYIKSHRQQQLFQRFCIVKTWKLWNRLMRKSALQKRPIWTIWISASWERVEKVMTNSQEIFNAEFSIDRLAELVEGLNREIFRLW